MHQIVFGTGNTERARFNASDGKLKIGDSNDAAVTFKLKYITILNG